MIILEHDAKELLAIQGIPVPGGVMLRQPPKYTDGEEDAGPWLVKVQIPGIELVEGQSSVVARNAREVANAATRLLSSAISGQDVVAVRVEQKLDAAHHAYLRFDCDANNAGVRVSVAPGNASLGKVAPKTVKTDTAVPDPSALIACAGRLAAMLPAEIRNQVSAAARMLAPLYFGYEAISIEIDPLMIFDDGSWIVGDVDMRIDENALFRHPELIALMDRRGDSYLDVRHRRELGFDFSVVDQNGYVGILTNGTALALYLINALYARGLAPYNFIDLRANRITDGSDCLATALGRIADGPKVRAVLINLDSGGTDISAIAEAVLSALEKSPINVPAVIRLTGPDSAQAERQLARSGAAISIAPDLDGAFELVRHHVADKVSP